MLDRDWLDGLIRKIFGDEPAMTGSGLQFSRDGAFRLRDAILAAQSHRHSWEGPIWCCDVCGPCESEPCGLGNCTVAPELPSAKLLRDVLEASCKKQGLSIMSPWEPDKPAPNFILAQRLGIGDVFGIPAHDANDVLDIENESSNDG